jgi:hypothetical protein
LSNAAAQQLSVGLIRGPDGKPIFDVDPRSMPAALQEAYRREMTSAEQKEYFG